MACDFVSVHQPFSVRIEGEASQKATHKIIRLFAQLFQIILIEGSVPSVVKVDQRAEQE